MNSSKSIVESIMRAIEKISLFGMWLASIMVALSVLLIVAETLNRITFFVNVSFAEELTGYALVFICLVAGADAIRRGDFIRLYIVTKKLPQKLQHASLAVSFAIGFFMLYIYLCECIVMVKESLSYHAISHTVFKTPLWLPQIFIVIGLGMMLVQVAVGVVRNVCFIFRPPNFERNEQNAGSQ